MKRVVKNNCHRFVIGNAVWNNAFRRCGTGICRGICTGYGRPYI